MSFKPLLWRTLTRCWCWLPVRSGCSMKEQHVRWFWCIMWERGGALSMQLVALVALPSLSSQCRPRKRWSSNGSFVFFFFTRASFEKCKSYVSLTPSYVTLLRTLTHPHTRTRTRYRSGFCHCMSVCEMLPVNLNCVLTVALNTL